MVALAHVRMVMFSTVFLSKKVLRLDSMISLRINSQLSTTSMVISPVLPKLLDLIPNQVKPSNASVTILGMRIENALKKNQLSSNNKLISQPFSLRSLLHIQCHHQLPGLVPLHPLLHGLALLHLHLLLHHHGAIDLLKKDKSRKSLVMPRKLSLNSKFKRKKELDFNKKWTQKIEQSMILKWNLRKLPSKKNQMAQLLNKRPRLQKSLLRLLEKLLRLLMRRVNIKLNLKQIKLLLRQLRRRERLNSRKQKPRLKLQELKNKR